MTAAVPSLHADTFLFSLREQLNTASQDSRNDARTGAAAWTGFVFQALEDAALHCGMRSCAARATRASAGTDAWWTQREHLFDVTWFGENCSPWDTPVLILEHENEWDVNKFLYDFWKLLLGFAPLRIMVGYSRRKEDHSAWIQAADEVLSKGVVLPDKVDDLILLGHKEMLPTGYTIYRRMGRNFKEMTSLASVSMPNPNDRQAWSTYIQRARANATTHIHAEVNRLKQEKIIDDMGVVIVDGLPLDMIPTAGTSTITG